MSLVRQKILQKILDVDNIPSLYSVHSCLAATFFISLKKNALLEKVAALEWKVTFSMHKNC